MWAGRGDMMSAMLAPDVDQLLPLLDDGAVLGLGEPTHGSANAFAWKLDILAELARRRMLGAFAIEDSLVAGQHLERALHGDPDLDVALALGSSVWRTEAIREGLRKLASILAAYQEEPLPRVLGIDVRAPHRTARALRDLGHDDPLLHLVAERAGPAEQEPTALAELCARIEQTAAPQAAALARNLGRHVDAYLSAPDLARLHRRDTHMASTLLESLPERGITVVWAHNEHIARNPDFYGGPSMGVVLDAELGSRYVPVGLMCGEGEARAADPSTGDDDWQTVPLPPLRPGTTDASLTARGSGLVTRTEFAHPGPRRFLGWRIDSSLFGDTEAMRESFEIERPSSDFDALVMLGRSTADVTADLPEPQTTVVGRV